MTRPPYTPERSTIEIAEIEAYDRTIERVSSYSEERKWGAPPGGVQPYYGALLHSPRLADCVSGIGEVITKRAGKEGIYTAADREWADLVAARILHFNRAFYSHVPEAVKAGVSPAMISALLEGRESDLDPYLRRLGSFIARVIEGAVGDDDYQWVEERFGTRGAIEFTTFIGFLMLNFRVMQAFGMPDRTEADLIELVEKVLND